MQNESPSTDPKPTPKKRSVLKHLVIYAILGVIAYFAGPHVMTRVMLMEENAKTRQPAQPVKDLVGKNPPTPEPTGDAPPRSFAQPESLF